MAGTARAENGSAGWLRYSRITAPATIQQYRLLPRRIVQVGVSPLERNAAAELERGLRSMLGGELEAGSTLPDADAFVVGTPDELRRLLPQWEQPAKLAPEGFALSRLDNHGHHLWIIAGGGEAG